MNKYEDLRAAVSRLIKEGAELDSLICCMHNANATIVESMRILVEVAGTSLREAKMIVSGHQVWEGVVGASVPMHDEMHLALSDRSSARKIT